MEVEVEEDGEGASANENENGNGDDGWRAGAVEKRRWGTDVVVVGLC